MEDIFRDELALIPTSLLGDAGDMRITKTKSVLNRKLQVEQSGRTLQQPHVVIVGVCHFLDYSLAISGYSTIFCEWFLAVNP